MAVEFSLVPGPSLDIIGIPDVEVFKNFINGDLGISDSIRDSFIQKITAGVEGDSLDTFSNLMEGNGITNGIKSFEKTIIQSIFETQKPYIEIAKAVMDGVVIAEDIIAASLAGISSKSLKPISNKNSLYSKLNKSKEDIDEVNKLSKPSYNSFKDVPEENKMNGIPIEQLNELYKNKPNIIRDVDVSSLDTQLDFITVSIYYSTGAYIKGIPYDYTYKYIVDNPNNNNSYNGDPNAEPVEIPRNYVDDIKPIMIFDIWVDDNGDGRNLRRVENDEINRLPWNIDDKWNGNWSQWSKNPIIFKDEYVNYVTDKLNDDLDINNIDDIETRNEIIDMVINSIPFNDTENNTNFHEELGKSSIYNINNGINDPLTNTWRSSNQFGIKPKKINGIWYDPESDYNLQIIKLTPSYFEPNTNINITNNPLSNKYDTIDIKDILPLSDYDPTKFKFISHNGDNITNRFRHDNTYVDISGNIIKDKKIYYIIEGIHKDRLELIDSSGSNGGSDPLTQSKKYYKFGKPAVRLGRSISYVISRFIKFVGSYVVKIISLIKKAITLLTKPFNFIFEILMEKVGETFDMFGSDIISKISRLKSISDIKRKKEYVENDPQLKQMISFDEDENYRIVTDGSGFISFLGLGFGIGTTGLSPKLTIDYNPNIDSLISSANNYIDDADSLSKEGSNEAEVINLRIKAMEKLQIAQNINPNNEEVSEKMKELQTNVGVQTNMLFQSIMDIIALPIKIVTKLIEYILDFFKSLKPTNIPTKIPEFLTFKWILDFFKPSKIFDLLGIKIDPSKLTTWVSELDPLGDLKNFDTSKILEFPIIGKLDTYDNTTLMSLVNGGSKILLMATSLFKFIQEILNKIMCFLFNIFNIDVLFDCPKINLTKFTDGSLTPEDISLMLEQDDIDFLSDNDEGGQLYTSNRLNEIYSNIFLYDIILKDGKTIGGLTYEEMKLYVVNNPNIQYKYDFI